MDLSPQDLDAVTRTVLSEAGQDGDPGMTGVAAVIKNRVDSGQYGASPSAVVQAPNQFSAWNLPANDPNSPSRWSTKSPQYQRASQIVNSVWSGETPDPTGGADHYLNPKIVLARRGSLPGWAQGQPSAQIGGHSFYSSQPQALAFDTPSPDEVANTANMFGIKQYVPVTSGAGGITISVPSGQSNSGASTPTSLPQTPYSANVTPDDVAETAKMFGIGNAPTAKAPLPANMQQPTNVDIHATPEVQAAAAKIVPNLGFGSAVAEGMPIISPALNAATAATGAVIQPYVDPNAAPTFAQRFSTNMAVQNEAQRQFDALHPVQAVTGNLIGGGMVLGPLGQTTIGGAALGLPNATRMGATLGGTVSILAWLAAR